MPGVEPRFRDLAGAAVPRSGTGGRQYDERHIQPAIIDIRLEAKTRATGSIAIETDFVGAGPQCDSRWNNRVGSRLNLGKAIGPCDGSAENGSRVCAGRN